MNYQRPYRPEVDKSYAIMQGHLVSQMSELHKNRQKAIHQHSKDLEESYAGAVPCHGKFLVNGPGEAEKIVYFPVAFSNVPVVTFGFEVKSNNNLVWTSYSPTGEPELREGVPARAGAASSGLVKGDAPIITAIVAEWLVNERVPVDRHFVGAKIITVCDGPSSTKFITHWTASGIAFSNPTVGPMGETATSSGVTGMQDRLAHVMWQPGRAGWYDGQWYRKDETPPGYGG